MGGRSSKQRRASNPYAGKSKVEEKKKSGQRQQQQIQRDTASKVATTSIENQMIVKDSPVFPANSTTADEFYDGIPRYKRSLSLKSRSFRATKVSEVSSRLTRAGSVGLGRAVDVLDTVGSSVANLTITGGFVSGATIKNNELSILSFEVANTIMKGSSLMLSLSKRSIRQLKEAVFPSKGVQLLISTDMDELLRIVAADKREELKVFAGEVIRFGNRCKDPQWHNLDRFYEKRSKDRTPQKQLMEVAESVMVQLMTSVQLTADLYQELHALDKSEQDYQQKRLEEFRFNAGRRGDRDNSLNMLAAEIKRQKKQVKKLKKKSLWSRSMEEVMEKLVDIVLFLNQEINHALGNPESETPEKGAATDQQKLGPAGLSLHYANIILQIDAIVARSGSMPPDSRETLYQSLPPNIKDSLRSKLHSFHVKEELTVQEIKDEMEKTLHWLAVVATNTAKAHHGFGWVGEWANPGPEANRRTAGGPVEIMQIETLHHADKQKTEEYIIDLLLWLNSLVSRSKPPIQNKGDILRASPVLRSSSKNAGKQDITMTHENRNAEKIDDIESVGVETVV